MSEDTMWMTDEELRTEMEEDGHPLASYVSTLSDKGFNDFHNWLIDVIVSVINTGGYSAPPEGIPHFEGAGHIDRTVGTDAGPCYGPCYPGCCDNCCFNPACCR